MSDTTYLDTTYLIGAPDSAEIREPLVRACQAARSVEDDAHPMAGTGVRSTGKPEGRPPKGDPDAVRTLARMAKIAQVFAAKMEREAANLTSRQQSRASWEGEVTSIGGVTITVAEKGTARHLTAKYGIREIVREEISAMAREGVKSASDLRG